MVVSPNGIRRGGARRAREREAARNADSVQAARDQQVTCVQEHTAVTARQLEAGHPGAQALPAPGTPKNHLLSGRAGAISPTMSHNSPVGAITRLPSQKELQEELERAKARRVAATDDEERGFYEARVAKIKSQITCAMSPGHRLNSARKQRDEAVRKLTANFKHLEVAQDYCSRASLKYRKADEYYNKVREETAGIDIPAQVPDANIAGMLQSFLS